MYDIVIVGGGPRGTYCLRRLALRLQGVGPLPPVCIHVVEKSPDSRLTLQKTGRTIVAAHDSVKQSKIRTKSLIKHI